MDDLTGLNWTSAGSGDTKQKPPPMGQNSYSYTLRSTPPLSGRSTPLTAPQNKLSPNALSRSNASTPANDTFANLVAFNAANPSKNLSLLEQQKKLQEERTRQQQEKIGSQFGRHDEEFWEKLGSGTSTPNPGTTPSAYTAAPEYGSQILSATIDKPLAGVDTSQRRHLPPSTDNSDLLSGLDNVHGSLANGIKHTKPNDKSKEAKSFQEQVQAAESEDHNGLAVDDDDPFGLGSQAPSSRPTPSTIQTTVNDEDDILGLLGRPISEFAQPQEYAPQFADKAVSNTSPADRALAELVDMGFAPEKSRQALEMTESGTDVQAAVGWLLNQAHHDSRSSSRGGKPQSERQESRQSRRSPPRKRSSGAAGAEVAQPAWMKNTAQGSTHQSRQSSRSPVNGEKDSSKIAAELGTNLFKTANSLWKTGTKKLNQAVADLNSDSDSSQPRWMREPRVDRNRPATESQSPEETHVNGHKGGAKHQRPTIKPDSGVTDEALMLETPDVRPQPRKPPRPKPETNSVSASPRPASPPLQAYRQDSPQPRFMQHSKPNVRQDPKSRLSKQAVEEQTTEAYISPARRKKTNPKPPAPEPDLLSNSSQTTSNTTLPTTASKPNSQPPSQQPTRTPKAPQPQVPRRNIPPISSTALQTSHTSRQAGSAAFKRGDYAEATIHYSSALAPLPPTHPLNIPILTNRALSHLKTGDPKACVADTITALELIGPSRGVAETVDLGNEGTKDMYTYWGKTMTRQAEALEQLEKWPEAGGVWKTCVEAGVGGGTSIAGRNRCEKAVKGPSQSAKPAAAKQPPSKPKPKASALDDLSATPSATLESGEAVTRLRAANLAAERLDDEKFALSDKVSERVSRWRSGKEGNLRALLASLDTVLWEESGWKKVGMGELILPARVKVVYMKGIGKCHPDKVGFFSP
ncbi:MAG: hypothetical protein Q9225_000613 [Loekoesia sp. 1 TL-2023]